MSIFEKNNDYDRDYQNYLDWKHEQEQLKQHDVDMIEEMMADIQRAKIHRQDEVIEGWGGDRPCGCYIYDGACGGEMCGKESEPWHESVEEDRLLTPDEYNRLPREIAERLVTNWLAKHKTKEDAIHQVARMIFIAAKAMDTQEEEESEDEDEEEEESEDEDVADEDEYNADDETDAAAETASVESVEEKEDRIWSEIKLAAAVAFTALLVGMYWGSTMCV